MTPAERARLLAPLDGYGPTGNDAALHLVLFHAIAETSGATDPIEVARDAFTASYKAPGTYAYTPEGAEAIVARIRRRSRP